MLNQDEVEHFRTFGFIVRRQIFSGEEMAGITSEFDDVLAEGRGYEPFDGKQPQAVQPFVEKRKLLTNVVADDRIYLPLQQLLGEGFIWVGSDGNLYIGDTEWHGDRFQGEDGDHQPWDYAAIKVVFYFDPVRADSGCLRVIPGSQRQEFGDHLEFMWRLGAPRRPRPFGLAPEEVPSAALESDPGDLVFFSMGMAHASFGGGAGRRMLALSFMPAPRRHEHVAFLRRAYGRMTFGLHPVDRWLAHENPRIRGMVEPLATLGFETIGA